VPETVVYSINKDYAYLTFDECRNVTNDCKEYPVTCRSEFSKLAEWIDGKN
jgi:hypothetical protein